VLFILLLSGIANAQTQQTLATEKKGHADVFNELYCSYGIGSFCGEFGKGALSILNLGFSCKFGE